jgi:hypothetical protein
MPDTANVWIPHRHAVLQFFHGGSAVPELEAGYNDLALGTVGNMDVLIPTIAGPLLNSENPPHTAVTIYSPSGGYSPSGPLMLAGTDQFAGTGALSATATTFSATGLVCGTVYTTSVYDSVNGDRLTFNGNYSHLNYQPEDPQWTVSIHGVTQVASPAVALEATTTTTDAADDGLDAARDIYLGAFRQVFGREIAAEITSFISDGEIHWRFTTRVPRALYDDVERLLDLENVAHEHVRALAPELLGFFSFQYSPDDGETSRLS